METFNISFYYNNIRFGNKELYGATVIKDEGADGSTYYIHVNCRKLQKLYGNLRQVKKYHGWEWSYGGDVDLFNLEIQVSEAIELYESHSDAYAVK